MAFVEKKGKRYQVKKGNDGSFLSSFTTKKAADAERDRLHRKNKPTSANRGKSAKKRHIKRERK